MQHLELIIYTKRFVCLLSEIAEWISNLSSNNMSTYNSLVKLLSVAY